jgi:CTP:molybdopterin cytidylyltransferase MocA
MGRSKALMDFRGEPLVLAHVRALRTRCEQVHVVLGHESEMIREVLPDEAFVHMNSRWRETDPRSSLLVALETVDPGTTILLTPVDTLPVPPGVSKALFETGPPAVPTYQGQPGHPVLFLAQDTLEGLRRGLLLSSLLETASRVPVDWPGCRANLNTPGDWRAWVGPVPGD